MSHPFSLVIHGGAGDLKAADDPAVAARYLDAMRGVLEQGRHMLTTGALAVDVVEACAALLEDDPLFNAGRGSVVNEEGRIEMDAAIMDGRDLSAGAVAAVPHIANPTRLARLVQTDARHLMYAGEGALKFAERHGMSRMPDDYFLTTERLRELTEAVRDESDKHGTIGAVARDLAGNLAAATSTGGTTAKAPGRVGDSPIIGAGIWADNATCAVSCTGVGEDFMRTVLAKTIADHMELLGADGPTAADAGRDYLVRKVRGRGGFILVDRNGQCSTRFTTRRMIHGWIEHGGKTVCRL